MEAISASSGHAGDGMSVRWHDVQVENVDDSTLRITWVCLPVDDVVRGLTLYPLRAKLSS